MPRRTPYDSSPTDAVEGRVVLASMQSHLDPETEYGYPPIVEFLPLLNPLSPHDHDGFVAVGDVAMQCHFPQPQIRFGGGGQRSSTPETRPTNQSIHSELLQTQRHSHSPYGHPVLARLTTEDETRQQQQHTPEDAQQSPHTLKRRQSGGQETFSMNTSITRTPYQTYKQFNSQPSDEVHSAFLLGGPSTSHGNNNGSNTPLLTGISTPQQYRRGAGRATPNGQHQPYGDLQCTPVQHSTPQHIRLQYPRPSSVTHESGDPYMPGVTVHYEKPPSSPAIYIKDLQHHQAQHLTHRSPPTVNLGFSPIARTVGQQQGGTPQTQARKPSAAGAAAAGSHTPSHGSRPPTGKSMKRAASALSMLSAAAIETTAAILDPNTPLQLHQELRFSPSSMLPGQSPGNPFAQQLLPPPAAASPTPLLLLECEDDRCTSPTLYADRVHRFMSIALQIPQLALRSHQKLDPQSTDLEDLRLQFGEATAADAADNDDAENDQDEGGDSDLETGGVSPNNATAAQQPELLTAEEKEMRFLQTRLQRRINQRIRQIQKGKDTDGYKLYLLTVRLEDREYMNRQHPITPRVLVRCSKRAFDAQLSDWRTSLHRYDAVVVDAVEIVSENRRSNNGDNDKPDAQTCDKPSATPPAVDVADVASPPPATTKERATSRKSRAAEPPRGGAPPAASTAAIVATRVNSTTALSIPAALPADQTFDDTMSNNQNMELEVSEKKILRKQMKKLKREYMRSKTSVSDADLKRIVMQQCFPTRVAALSNSANCTTPTEYTKLSVVCDHFKKLQENGVPASQWTLPSCCRHSSMRTPPQVSGMAIATEAEGGGTHPHGITRDNRPISAVRGGAPPPPGGDTGHQQQQHQNGSSSPNNYHESPLIAATDTRRCMALSPLSSPLDRLPVRQQHNNGWVPNSFCNASMGSPMLHGVACVGGGGSGGALRRQGSTPTLFEFNHMATGSSPFPAGSHTPTIQTFSSAAPLSGKPFVQVGVVPTLPTNK